MSELAFNIHGETFEIPAAVAAWRVRRVRPRGAPELIYGGDGRPLTIPLESDHDDLRNAVGTPAKYRLDPIDEDGKTVEGVPAAYVQVTKPEPAASQAIRSVPATSDDVVREAMRLNTELAKSVIDRFPEMMTAAAELIRAADGAGIPARPPRAIDVEDEGDEEAPVPPAFDLNALVAQLVPVVLAGLGSGKSKLPGLGAMLDWRKAAAIAEATTADAAAPATVGAKRGSERLNEERAVADANLPPIDTAAMAHLMAVQTALTEDERLLARELVNQLAPSELRAWVAELSKVSIPEAVAKIRGVLGGGKAHVS